MPAPTRVQALDVLRGAAVLGILAANLPGFGLPQAAAFSPAAAGGRTGADLWAWTLNFVLVEGRMRGLFSFLFGASMLLMAERAGDDAAGRHYSRMAWLYLFGLAHLYLLWWGDILAHYALVGCLAFPFRRLGPRALVATGAALVAVQFALALDAARLAFAATPGSGGWAALQSGFGTPPARDLAAEVAAMRGSWGDGVAWRWRTAASPIAFLPAGGAETLGYMLLGMAGYRSGLLAGGWPAARMRRWAMIGLGAGLPAYALLARGIVAHGFDARWTLFLSYALTVPLRAAMIPAYACALLLLPGGVGRLLARAGRAAFSNYLGTSLVMGFAFGGWGLGLFDRLHRATLYALLLPAWGVMLWWPAVWLRRYRTGPLEWLWRSLSRLEWQPLRR